MLGGGSRGAALVLASLLALAAAPACSNGDDEDDRAAEAPAEPLPRLRAVRGERPAVVDELGRQVVLRGINLNSLSTGGSTTGRAPGVRGARPPVRRP